MNWTSKFGPGSILGFELLNFKTFKVTSLLLSEAFSGSARPVCRGGLQNAL